MTDEAAAAIAAMPAWSDVTSGDQEGLATAEAAARRVAELGPDAVQAGAARYVAGLGDAYDVAAMSRLYVLARLLFDVPERVPADAPGFAAFLGIPYGDGWIGELWPWEHDAHGRLRLAGFFSGYGGESYLAVQEMESFRQRFGPRE